MYIHCIILACDRSCESGAIVWGCESRRFLPSSLAYTKGKNWMCVWRRTQSSSPAPMPHSILSLKRSRTRIAMVKPTQDFSQEEKNGRAFCTGSGGHYHAAVQPTGGERAGRQAAGFRHFTQIIQRKGGTHDRMPDHRYKEGISIRSTSPLLPQNIRGSARRSRKESGLACTRFRIYRKGSK
jgi:hypothetical protein